MIHYFKKMETWANIADYPKYMVSDHGRVKSLKRQQEKIITPKRNKDTTHLRIILRNENGKKHFYVHRLVAKAFIPNPDLLPHIDHIDRIANNNILSNLRWTNPSNNQGNRCMSINNKSGYKGVHWDSKGNKWIASIVKKYIGTFTNKEDAARAYNTAAIEKFGEFACINELI
jgi:hypothetical protein